MLNILIFGPPGSGKGTQAVKIAHKYNIKHISTGDILRQEVKDQSDLGKKAQSIMERGELVPDELLIQILHSVIGKNNDVDGFIFDGFPRTLVQAEELDTLMGQLADSVKLVISLDVHDQEVIARLLKRAEIEGRKDDNEHTIANRLHVYKKQTMPLLEYYKNQGKLKEIAGIGSIDDIFEKICQAINNLLTM